MSSRWVKGATFAIRGIFAASIVMGILGVTDFFTSPVSAAPTCTIYWTGRAERLGISEAIGR